MTDVQMIPSKVHLVGSVRMDNAEEMFREVGPSSAGG